MAVYFGIMVAPPIFGFLAEKISAALLPVYLAVWVVIFAAATFFFLRYRGQRTADE